MFRYGKTKKISPSIYPPIPDQWLGYYKMLTYQVEDILQAFPRSYRLRSEQNYEEKDVLWSHNWKE